VDAKDTNPQYFVWEINSVAVHCKDIEALGRAETLYAPGGDSEFAGATYAGGSAASGNGFVHITCAGMTALTQIDGNALFVVTPSPA
jgi:hypothetical protein